MSSGWKVAALSIVPKTHTSRGTATPCCSTSIDMDSIAFQSMVWASLIILGALFYVLLQIFGEDIQDIKLEEDKEKIVKKLKEEGK